MDAEDEEAPQTKPSLPFQPHPDPDADADADAPVDLSTTVSQCDTGLQNFTNSGGGDVPPAPVHGGDAEVVITGKSSEADAVVVSTDEIKETVMVVADGGSEVQVMDVAGNEIVEDRDSVGMDDSEKRNASGSCVVGVEDEIVEGKGNEGTDVDDMVLETGKVEEEANLTIGENEDDGETNEVALTEGKKEQQQEEEEEEKQHQPEAEADADAVGSMAEDTEDAEETNEAALMEEEEEEQEQEQQRERQEAEGEGDAVGGLANDKEDAEETNEAALMKEEEEEEEEQQQRQEVDADADDGMAEEDTEAAEEIEVTEEQSTSVSGGKRKRGAGKNAKSAGRVPSKKKMEEDVCFICFDGGDLVLCDRRGCPKAYHPSCVNRDEAFFRAKGRWNCGWHLCSICEKNAYYMCYTCTFSLCKGCIKDAVILCVRGNKGFCETCMRTVMLIEQNEQGNNMGQVDFDDKNSWEYLFKDYYIDLKGKLSLTFEELTQAKNPWKGSDVLPSKEESPDELFEGNNDRGSDSDRSYENVDLSRPTRRKAKKRAKMRSKEGSSYSAVTVLGADGPSADGSFEWASKELLEFVMHMRNEDKSVLSQFDVQALLLEYIKRNKLRDPRRKSQIICDARLQNLFGKPRVGHFEMLKLLESHFLLKDDSQAEDLQGSVVDTEVSHLEGDGNADSFLKAGKDRRRKTRKKGDERGLQSNVDDYAAIDNHNINLIYLRRNLVEDILEDMEKFHDKVVGSFVRIRISGSGQKQDLYRLVQVVGTCKAAEPYKVGKRMADILLEILNLNKTEIVSIDIISNQEFTEDECKRLRQSIKCGLINRLTVGDIQDKALALQAVRVKDWLETEIMRLSHLRDRASEKGRRKELRECVEKLQLLKTPEERQRRLEEIPEIHVDPNMDPSYESEEDEEEMDNKRQENYMRPRGSAAFGRRGMEIVSPRSGSISSDSWTGTRNYSNVNRELSRNLSSKGFSLKGDDVSNASEALNDAQLHQGRDRESQLSNSWERQKLSSSFESGAKSSQPLVTSESFSTAVLEASATPSCAGIAPPAVKINETEKMWHYKDPSGKVQGPFSMVQLRKWSNTGYFPADLRIWRTTEKQDESILLTDALAGKVSKEPPMVGETLPKAQTVHLAAQKGIEGQVGGRSTFDQNSGSWNLNSTLGSPGQTTGGIWRSKDNINSVANRPSPLAVEVPKNPANGWGSDAGVRNESTNLPSPTPQPTSGATKGQAFENTWSPTPVQLAGSLLRNSFPGGPGGLQASGVVLPENVVQNTENGSSSQAGMTSASKSEKGMILSSTDTQVHPQATTAAPVLTSGVDIKMAGVQNQVVSSHNSRIEAQGWGSGLVQKPEQQAWGGTPSQWIEPNNPATMPVRPASHGLWGDASSIQNSTSFSTGNPTGSLPTPGFVGMTTPEPWRPPTSSNQSNITAPAPAPPNIPWGMGLPGNQNINWGSGAFPANMNMNMSWMPAQVAAPGNANPGWAAPSQGVPPVNAVGWVAPGQGGSHVSANAGWVVPGPGQGLAPGSANPGWSAPAGNQGVWGSEQSHNGDRFPNQGDRGTHGGGGDSGYGGKSWNRQSSFSSGGRGGSSRPPFGGQRGVCRFHESGHCRKGASCDFLHP
ncbi:zinc finger CCCH domain-containing protein 19-like [Gastrolobium bilobum]|uniref:zinc finger CCCH domain-containing protein 19-like n=1 Tax=Gastrolobium bilobum TaxID=150636 RepID=UPI002AB0304A|nr:zinc finger CCCH domain-containing protein 19-like [Gastrolobium bilobum]